MFINKISPSKSDIIDQCLLKYYYRYILGVPGYDSPNKPQLNFGSFIHKVFEIGCRSVNLKELGKISEDQRPNYHIPFNLNESINICLEHFVRLNSKLGEPKATELKFEVEIAEGIIANGVIDRLNEGKEGGFFVIDYKTSKREKTKKDLIFDKQLRCYAYAIHKMFNVPYNKIHCGHYYPLSDNLVTVQYSEYLVETWRKEEVNKVWKIRKKTKTEFPPMENMYCSNCEYKDMCPRFNSSDAVDRRVCEQLEAKKKLDEEKDRIKLEESSEIHKE